VKIDLKIPNRELEEQRFGPGTRMALLMFQSKNKIPKTGILDEDTRPALEFALARAGGGEGGADPYLAEGQIIIHNKMPAQEHSIIVTI
jgi:peptidoglycan hydrolase-like protein with peptidoglycan-binding domain